MPITIAPHFTIPDYELDVSFTPSGGPGGQHANKAATRVELVWDIENSVVITDPQRSTLLATFGERLRVVVDDERSQVRNREIAHHRLAERVSVALTPRRSRKATRPSRSARRRRMDAKTRRSQTKANRRRPSIDD